MRRNYTQTDAMESLTPEFAALAQELYAMLNDAAVADVDSVGWIRVTGEDRVRWLNGMFTNNIQTLQPGEGCYNFALNSQGRIQADAVAFAVEGEDALLIESTRAADLVGLLDRFIIMDDVELTLLPSDTRAGLVVLGPRAIEIVAAALQIEAGKPGLNLSRTTWQGTAVDRIDGHSPLVPRVELWAEPGACERMRSALIAAGAHSASPGALDCLRLMEGTPRYGVDIREKELPQETAQVRALHFSKGCYLGQEIVERIRSRGNVHRTFAGFRLQGALPEAGASLFLTGSAADPAARPVGELTSAAFIPILPGIQPEPLLLALGYIRREVLERGDTLVYRAPDGRELGRALPVSLPLQWKAAAPEALAH